MDVANAFNQLTQSHSHHIPPLNLPLDSTSTFHIDIPHRHSKSFPTPTIPTFKQQHCSQNATIDMSTYFHSIPIIQFTFTIPQFNNSPRLLRIHRTGQDRTGQDRGAVRAAEDEGLSHTHNRTDATLPEPQLQDRGIKVHHPHNQFPLQLREAEEVEDMKYIHSKVWKKRPYA
jgi:hypothetical protein